MGARIVGDDRDQFSAGRKPHDADPSRIHAIAGRVGPHPADGPTQVGGGLAFDRVGRSRLARQTVLQHEGGDAVAVEGLGRPGPLIDEDQHAMPAARHDDDGRAVGVARVGGEHGQGRIVDVAHIGVLDDFALGGPALRTWRSTRPKQNRRRTADRARRLGRRERGAGQQRQDGCGMNEHWGTPDSYRAGFSDADFRFLRACLLRPSSRAGATSET
jgi:hypothetical protein